MISFSFLLQIYRSTLPLFREHGEGRETGTPFVEMCKAAIRLLAYNLRALIIAFFLPLSMLNFACFMTKI